MGCLQHLWDRQNVQLVRSNATLSFEGTAVKALIARPSNASGVDSSWYKVFIDGIFLQDIPYKDYNAATEILLAENLTEGTHTVTIYKRTETQMGSQLFLGFSVSGTSTTILKTPSRCLEFIGNSITCGDGVLDSCFVNASTWAIEGTCPGFTTTSEDHYYSSRVWLHALWVPNIKHFAGLVRAYIRI